MSSRNRIKIVENVVVDNTSARVVNHLVDVFGYTVEKFAPMLASLLATCKTSGVNSLTYIAKTLRAILDGHPKSRIEDLMPWNFPTASSLAA